MICHDLNLGGFDLRITAVVPTPSLLILALDSTAAAAACPGCGRPSDRVHSRYVRTLRDLPCHDRPAAIRLTVRRFRCSTPGCPTAIFCERIPGLLDAHARTTARLADVHRLIGFALGGEPGSRLAEELAAPASPDTLRRRVKRHHEEPGPSPRFVGVDDWAWRKGQSYGTILIDLERGRVIDILPGRDGAALAEWLRSHPGVEVLTRDRWAAFAQAASEGAPQALQVADRWHLLKNLREAVERLLGRHAAEVDEALKPPPPPAQAAAPPPTPQAGAQPDQQPPSPTGAAEQARVASPRELAREGKRRQRAERYQRVRELRERGHSIRQVARVTGLNVKAVRRYCREGKCPDWNPGRRGRSRLDAFAGEVDSWVAAGGRNAAELFRELKEKGCAASYDAVRRFVSRRVGSCHRPGPRTGPCVPPPAPRPSARQLSFEFIKRQGKRKADEQARVDRLHGGHTALKEALVLAGEFAQMVRKESKQALAEWLGKAEHSSCGELRTFAQGLRQDEAAVAAALTEPWSNGPVEGQVNRLKLIKRQGYGRAGFELLRARVRHAS